MTEISISVRSLVEFLLREGDISEGSGITLAKDAMNAGSRIHRKLQKSAGSFYNAEVPLKLEINTNEYKITVEGRADGIIEKDAQTTIDEIKGMYKRVEDMEQPINVHVAQAKCYAYIYARKKSLDSINVQMTYVNLDTEGIKHFVLSYTFAELEKWFMGLMNDLEMWADMALEHCHMRDESISDMNFPFEYRNGQYDMTASVYSAIVRSRKLFVQAPTGIGKTMAAVYPAIKSFEKNLTSKIFYLTAKTVAGTVARNAVKILTDRGLDFKLVVITAKEKLCPMTEMVCDAESCPYAKGHYDRVNEALYDLVSSESTIDRECISVYSAKYQVCPFELCLDASLFADMIVCDYNYVFDPRVNLKRFFANGQEKKEKYVFLVDEAHNLVDRASSMYSAVLIKEDILAAKRLIKKYSSRTAKALERCNKAMLELKKKLGTEEYQVLPDFQVLHFALLNAYSAMENFIEEHRNIPEKKEILEFFFKLNTFLNISELVDENYIIYDQLLSDGSFMLKLYNVLPAVNLASCLEKGICTVFFSATLLPVNYYKEMLSTDKDDYAIYIPSPFDRNNRRILLARDVTTRYNRRGRDEYNKIYEYIKYLTEAKEGNYMVFFPSYKMMNDIYDIAVADKLDARSDIIIQGNSMTEEEREEFLKHFSYNKNVVAFCIMGGIFSEGIDLDRDKLVGAAVVGPGLPQVCVERKLLMDYFDKKSGDGFKYAYIYPGINKVLQAAGRVIRTEEDKGIMLLLDERFTREEYYRLFPEEWSDCLICDRRNVEGILRDFWNK